MRADPSRLDVDIAPGKADSAIGRSTFDRIMMDHPNLHWRQANIGRLLNNAVRRFERRVLELLDEGGHSPARLSHLSLTRNLDVNGTRTTELARRAAITKQAMAQLVEQCEKVGLVSREDDPSDQRAKIVRFTPAGLAWLEAFHQALTRAESEMRAELGWLRVDGLVEALKAYTSAETGVDTTAPAARTGSRRR